MTDYIPRNGDHVTVTRITPAGHHVTHRGTISCWEPDKGFLLTGDFGCTFFAATSILAKSRNYPIIQTIEPHKDHNND